MSNLVSATFGQDHPLCADSKYQCVAPDRCLTPYYKGLSISPRIQTVPQLECPAELMCCKELLPVQQSCGTQYHRSGWSRVSDEAALGQYPWQGALLAENVVTKELSYRGGVSLVSPRFALTAAFKVDNRQCQHLLVRFGSPSLASKYAEDYRVAAVFVHHQYDNTTFTNNIALLRFERDVRMSTSVAIICLPFKQFDFRGVLDLARCQVAGWGAEAFNSRVGVTNLKRVVAQVHDDAVCNHQLSSALQQVFYRLHQSDLCAGGQSGKDSCSGDGGSPLVCPVRHSNQFFQVGIVSAGAECGKSGVPGIYTNVAKFSDWILSIIGACGM